MNRKIAIDIGHTSGRDQGAVSACGLSEHAYWSALVHIIVNNLQEAGHESRICRREDHGGSIAAECLAINAWGADAAVSLHLNSAANLQAGGHEVIHYPGSSRGMALATAINDSLNDIPELRDRKIRTPFAGRGDTWLSSTKCPAVIVEAGFLSNPDDVRILKARSHRIAELVSHGITRYLGPA